VVTIICFADILSWDNYYKIALNSILFKVIAALADTPFCYLGYYLIKKFLAKDEESLKKIMQ